MAKILERQNVEDHYHNVAGNYDDFFMEIHDAQLQAVSKKLQLQPDHVLLDVGGGTGRFSEQLFKYAQLRNPVICVEPNEEMHEKAKQRKGVIPVLKTAEDFFRDPLVFNRFDRVLFVQSDHHLCEPLSAFRDLERSLRPGGVCSIWQLKSHSCFQMFSDVAAAKSYPSDRHVETCRFLKEANFEVEMSWVHLQYGLTKSKLYSMLRGRFITNLYTLNDQEIEEGIATLERTKLKFVHEDDVIENKASYVVIQAKKMNNNVTKNSYN